MRAGLGRRTSVVLTEAKDKSDAHSLEAVQVIELILREILITRRDRISAVSI